MIRFLKALLHVLSIVVICTAMAACAPMEGKNAAYSGYDSARVAAQNTSIMDY